MILELSKRIATEDDLLVLALQGLYIPEHVVSSHMTDHPESVALAAYGVLKRWRKSQDDGYRAYAALADALIRVKMTRYVNEILRTDMYI